MGGMEKEWERASRGWEMGAGGHLFCSISKSASGMANVALSDITFPSKLFVL